jgi:hypothetical protein
MPSVRLIAAVCLLFLARPRIRAATRMDSSTRTSTTISGSTRRGNRRPRRPRGSPNTIRLFPATIYRWQDGRNRYSVTVVDYSDSEAIYTANHHSEDFSNAAYWQIDILGSIQYAATQYRMRPGVKVNSTTFITSTCDGAPAVLTNPDRSLTFVAIYLHENRLYILDAHSHEGIAAADHLSAVVGGAGRGRQVDPLQDVLLRQAAGAEARSTWRKAPVQARVVRPGSAGWCSTLRISLSKRRRRRSFINSSEEPAMTGTND